jgi:hypothetical protein
MPNQNNFTMPGAQFNAGDSGANASWLKRNSQKIAAGVILLLIAAGAFSFYRSYQERTALLKPAVEDIRDDIKTASPDPATLAASQVKGAETRTEPEVVKTDKDILVSPARGNGVTHLARQALKEYLKDKPELAKELTAEHKIYIEDYLRKNVAGAPNVLQMSDTISFSKDLIQNAIGQAQKLTDNQLENLQKYVPLAPSVNY